MTAQGTVVAEGTSPPSPKGRRALGVALAVAVLAVALDQGSKALAVAQLTSGERVPLVGDLFGLSLVYNPGAAFSLGSGSTWIFTLVGLLAAIAVVVFAVRLRGARWGAALGLVLGGAVGNLVDRIGPPLAAQVADDPVQPVHVALYAALPDRNAARLRRDGPLRRSVPLAGHQTDAGRNAAGPAEMGQLIVDGSGLAGYARCAEFYLYGSDHNSMGFVPKGRNYPLFRTHTHPRLIG